MMTKINTLADVHEFVLNKKISSIATNATNADNGVSTVDEKPCKEGRLVDHANQIRIVKTADISIPPTEYSYQYMLHTCDNNGNIEHKMLFKSKTDNLDKDGANDNANESYKQPSGTDEGIPVADAQLKSMIDHFTNSLPSK
jgi:hypothetical protein